VIVRHIPYLRHMTKINILARGAKLSMKGPRRSEIAA
jgi:hypothetical protein